MRSTPRDIRALCDMSIIVHTTAEQVGLLQFDESAKKARSRLAEMYAKKLIDRTVDPRGSKKYVYWLNKKGRDLLSSHEIDVPFQPWRPKNISAHDMKVAEVAVALIISTRQTKLYEAQVITEHTGIKKVRGVRSIIREALKSRGFEFIPDLVFAINNINDKKNGTKLLGFIEVDFGNEGIRSTIANKYKEYCELFDSKAYSTFDDVFNYWLGFRGFRVFWATTSKKRCQNMLELAQEMGIDDIMHFGELAKISRPETILDLMWIYKDKQVSIISKAKDYG